MNALFAALEHALREDVGLQKRLYLELGKDASTVSRWIGELSMPLWVYARHVVKDGAHRTLRIIAALAGYRLTPIRESKSVLARALEQINQAAALLQQCPDGGAA